MVSGLSQPWTPLLLAAEGRARAWALGELRADPVGTEPVWQGWQPSRAEPAAAPGAAVSVSYGFSGCAHSWRGLNPFP